VEELLMGKLIWALVAAGAVWGQGVEFIGLEDTTQKWAEDHLDRLPDGRIHYCAADLKKAGYADASVVVYIGDDRKMFTVVTVVEAKRAAEVRQRALPSREVPRPAEWTYESAAEVLRVSQVAADRAAAAKELRNFGARDGAWLALAAALRDPEDRVSMGAAGSLQWMRTHAARKVDWSAAAADLSAVLHGTNLFVYNELVRTLAATGVDPAMAGVLLGSGGARLLLACLAARHDVERTGAHALLVQLRGADLGTDPAQWETWLNTL
jgi:hypothetical protein